MDPFTNPLISGNPGNEAALTSLPPATASPANPSSITAYSETYGYDANGNRNARTTVLGATTTNYTYVADADNRVTSESQQVVGGATTSITYGYGGTGNPNILTRQVGTGAPPPQLETYSYDYQERLTGYIKQVSGTTTANYSYRYLPTGERLNKVNVAGGSNNEEWYYPDGADVTADYTKTTANPTYTLASTYVNGAGIDSKLARITGAGTELYYLGDGLGSVHRVINASQVVQNTVLTTAYGLPHPGFTPVVGQPDRYGFTQREVDSESGLLQFRARAYDPRLGRFTQTDPILGNRPLAHYSYGSNNPVSNIDPMGLQDVPYVGQGLEGTSEGRALQDKLMKQGTTLPPRVVAVMQGASAALEMTAAAGLAAAPEPTGLTKAGAVWLGGHAVDLGAASVRTWKDNRIHETYSAQLVGGALEAAGAPDLVVDYGKVLADAGPSMAGGAAAARISNVASSARSPAVQSAPAERLGLPPVVIGENMERVVRAARTEGADFFKVMRQVREAGGDALMVENNRWIHRRIAEGRTIIDIGEDATRNVRSPFYAMEKDAVRKALETTTEQR